MLTDRQSENNQADGSKTEATLILCGYTGERAKKKTVDVILQQLGIQKEVSLVGIWNRMKRNKYTIRRRSTANQHLPKDIIPKCQRFVLYVKKMFKTNNFRRVVAMDETSLFADNMGTTTLARKGSKEVNLKTTGYEKNFQTTVLFVNQDGTKNVPFIVFNGKGTSWLKENKNLRERNDILAMWTDNGWMNGAMTSLWLDSIFTEKDTTLPALLIWDSFRAQTLKQI